MAFTIPKVKPGPSANNPQTGTTVIAVEYDGGVVLGSDTRMTMGIYISSRSADKIAPLSDYVYVARSGDGAATELISDYVRHHTQQYELLLDDDLDVSAVVKLNMELQYRNKQLSSTVVVGGWDKNSGGQVYAIPQGGFAVRQKWAIDGSGGDYIYGACEDMYREGMTREEAEEMVTILIALAMSSDGGSGAMCRLTTIDSSGAHKKLVTPDKFPQMPNEVLVGRTYQGSSGGMIID